MPTVGLAQKAVALEACRVLHKAHEIDDHFMPIGKEMMKYANELYTWPNEKSGIPGRPGTTKRRQTYYKEVCVFDVFPEVFTLGSVQRDCDSNGWNSQLKMISYAAGFMNN